MGPNLRHKARITMAVCIMTDTCAFSITTTSRNTAFVLPQILRTDHHHRAFNKNVPLFLRAPPGSGYVSDEDEQSFFPDTYEPMMEYPGTMRPGRTPENQPFSSLPIQESDPDPVPWPHFQEIEWHHNWGSPHEHPIPMEDFIEMEGRWASAEMEAEIRAGARRGVRERREMEESQSAASFIVDDDDEDDEEDEIKLDLGEGVDAFIGTDKKKAKAPVVEDEDEDDDRDDFLLDLGLDGSDDISLDEEEDDVEEEEEEEPAFVSRDGTKDILEAMQSMIDTDDSEIDESGDSDIDLNFDDLDLEFGDGEEGEDSDIGEADDNDEDFMMDDYDMEDEGDEDMIPLDEMIGNEDMGVEDDFDDGGFDYD
jgi:hypothetical protein